MLQSKRNDDIFFWSFLIVGLTVQTVTYFLSEESIISMICGMLGICSVILCSRGNILMYVFGFAQVLTYIYICYKEQLYGTVAINVYYFITQIYGVFLWRQRLKEHNSHLIDTVPTRKLSVKMLLGITIVMVILSALTGYFLAEFTNDSQPYLDAYTTIPALVAQVLMILAYREQWYFWFFIDVIYIILWARAADYCLFVQHIFWIINCIYGFVNWTKALQKHE